MRDRQPHAFKNLDITLLVPLFLIYKRDIIILLFSQPFQSCLFRLQTIWDRDWPSR